MTTDAFGRVLGFDRKAMDMKIVVFGGTGLIGSKLVQELRERGHDPVVASPDTGTDALTGEGLPEAVRGAQVLVDVYNADWDDETVLRFFQTSTRNLLAAEAAAGVGHHVALSVVGTDRLPGSAYAGPEQVRLDELVRRLLSACNDPREVVTDPHARYWGISPSERSLLPGDDARLGITRFDDWLRRTADRASRQEHHAATEASLA
jgi:NAD-dependent epimerase/dehydratase family protein